MKAAGVGGEADTASWQQKGKPSMLQGCQQRGYLIDRISPRAPQVWELLLCCSVELFY